MFPSRLRLIRSHFIGDCTGSFSLNGAVVQLSDRAELFIFAFTQEHQTSLV